MSNPHYVINQSTKECLCGSYKHGSFHCSDFTKGIEWLLAYEKKFNAGIDAGYPPIIELVKLAKVMKELEELRP